eukprot:TRINITY_DN3523_c0_g1_i1.p1 TRINITY_DN3523_c0_g1~~TRINITY_DN3523_c0_g1_i1.p1  ORF type:complete len:270 (-),score=81.83 TRINITY_DN3523_c0_g1_i1:489-1298(-)
MGNGVCGQVAKEVAEASPEQLTEVVGQLSDDEKTRLMACLADGGAKKKVVIVNTSAAYMGEHPTGLWLEETAAPYYVFKEAGFEIVLASTKGGVVPIDAASLGGDFFTEAAKKFMHDGEAVGKLCHTPALTEVDFATVDAIYLSGGHGTCADFVENAALKAAVEMVYGAGKVVAADCHGPIGLIQCNKPDGTPLVAGLKCTAFSNSEEEAVGLTSAVPVLIETKFKEQGGLFEAAADWNSNVAVDGKLITGQNPQSSDACAKAVVEALK